jgi:hypothetical protein
MEISDLQNLPEGASKSDLQPYLYEYFDNFDSMAKELALSLLDELSDRQWHTYEVPDKHVKMQVRACLEKLNDGNNSYKEVALITAYCFALEKEY